MLKEVAQKISNWSSDQQSDMQRLKMWTFIYHCLQGNQNSSGLQFEVTY